jgi:HSP20 family protein
MCKVNSSLFVHHAFSISRRPPAGQTHWVPNTDVYELDDTLVVKVELAGMRREDLELVIEGNRLMISGHRPDGTRGSKCNFLVMEINYGPFECVLEIPSRFDLNRAKASYQNGFLEIEVPKAVSHPARLPLAAPVKAR